MDASMGDTVKALVCDGLQGFLCVQAPDCSQGHALVCQAGCTVATCGWGTVEGHGTTGAPDGEFATEAEPAAGRILGPGRRREPGRKARLWRRASSSPQAERPPSPRRSAGQHSRQPRRGAGAAPCPLTPVGAAAGSVGRGASGPGEAAPPPPGAPGGAFPSFPSALPRLPERPEAAPAACAARSAGRRRRRPELPALGAKQITVQSAGRLSEGDTHVPQTGYSETLSLPPALPGALSSLRSLLCPLHLSSPLLRLCLSPPLPPLPSPLLSPLPGRHRLPRLTLPFLPAQLPAPRVRARVTGASTSSMEQPSSRSLKVSTGVLRRGASPRLVAHGGMWLVGGRAALAESGGCLGCEACGGQ